MNKKKNVKKNKKNDHLGDTGKGIFAFGAGSIGSTAASVLGTTGAVRLLKAGPKEKYDYDKLHEIVRGEAPNDKLKMFHVSDATGSHFSPESASKTGATPFALKAGGKAYVAVPENNVAISAHELVHSRGGVSKPIGMGIYSASKFGTPLAGLYATIQGARGKDLTTGDDIGIAASVAPMLLEETRANVGAFNAIRKMKLQHGLLRTALPLVGSELSYATAAASPFIGHYVAKKFRGFEDSLSSEERKKNVKAK